MFAEVPNRGVGTQVPDINQQRCSFPPQTHWAANTKTRTSVSCIVKHPNGRYISVEANADRCFARTGDVFLVHHQLSCSGKDHGVGGRRSSFDPDCLDRPDRWDRPGRPDRPDSVRLPRCKRKHGSRCLWCLSFKCFFLGSFPFSGCEGFCRFGFLLCFGIR